MKKVLFIEDDVTVRENTAELIALAGYQVFTAENGKTGIYEAKKNLPDIIICDIMMPELNGYGVLQILSKDNATKHIPFIFLSAKTEYSDIRKGMNLGADDYLTKPYDESELFSAIESRLAKVVIHQENLAVKRTKNTEIQLKSLEHLKHFFIKNGTQQKFNAGEIIYHEGGNSNFVYLIVQGIIKTYKIDEQGKELITVLHKEDDFFGFTSFNNNIPYQESATAIENSTICRFTKPELQEVLKNNHHVTLELIDYLTGNVAEIKEHLLEMAYSSVRKKTASTILQFNQKMAKHSNESIKISRSDLASIAGIATETFIRTLSDFKKEGIIEIEARNIKILDLDKLKKVN
ncbi:response regulator [Lutibacter holmesii]|uniref:Response regulator n=1 Tax=Lutibacter holmesii TaxID=1137985 RepID=A0ABW3WMN9_9FLAO